MKDLLSVVDRRLLVNYRIDPEVAARLVPDPLRPQLVNGWAVAGICLIRLTGTRPRWAPKWLGLRSENAAHRIAVQWDTPQGVRSGVYIPRRDTSSLLAALAGGRLFPGEHRRAAFDVRESEDRLHISFDQLSVDVETTDRFRGSELFSDLDTASTFFHCGTAGYSATRDGRHLDGIELAVQSWQVTPVEVLSARSAYFEALPESSAHLDCALLMRELPATWRALPPLKTVGSAS